MILPSLTLMNTPQTPPAGNKTQYEEIDIPVALLSYADMLDISKVSVEPNQMCMTELPSNTHTY